MKRILEIKSDRWGKYAKKGAGAAKKASDAVKKVANKVADKSKKK